LGQIKTAKQLFAAAAEDRRDNDSHFIDKSGAEMLLIVTPPPIRPSLPPAALNAFPSVALIPFQSETRLQASEDVPCCPHKR
jgi:hypothetical protein